VKECRSRSVAVLTPSYLFAPQHIPGIRPIYEMWNISKFVFFLETFRVFSPYHFGPACKKISVGSWWFFWARGGKEKISTPNISPDCGRLFRRLCTKIQPFLASQMHQAHIFRPLDVCLAVSDMLRSIPTTLSVKEYRYRLWSYGIPQSLPGIGVIYKMRNLTNFNRTEFN